MGRYLMVLALPAFPLGPDAFEVETAFAEHLRMLREKLHPLARTLVLASPFYSAEERAGLKMTVIRAEEGIVFRPMYPAQAGKAEYLRLLPGVLRALREEVEQADVVHAGLSSPFFPFEFPALLMGKWFGKKTIHLTDIDNRTSARMNYRSGNWGLREYLTTLLLHNTFSHLQHSIAVRAYSLVMFKGEALSQDYGKGRPHVKNFLDAAFDESQLIAPAALDEKVRALCDARRPLRLIYFGRLVRYKGCEDMLRALCAARAQGAEVTFEVIGDGPERARLTALTQELGLGAVVTFRGALSFGPELFARLYEADVLLAAPLSQDTPRSALDAMAAGEVVLSYDTYYYEDLKKIGASVSLVPWRDVEAMGRRIVELARDREELARAMRAGRAFAAANTQEQWLEQRVAWTKALFQEENGSHDRSLLARGAAQPTLLSE